MTVRLLTARVMGAVLAGGQSTRFGSDKALAVWRGRTLLAHAVDQMRGWCDAVVVVGRDDALVSSIADWPRPGMGPLGGIAAALRHAAASGYAVVLTIGVDAGVLPVDLPTRLSPAPAFVVAQPVIGLWPVHAAATVEAILASDGRHSMWHLAEAIGARGVELARPPANINTPADLAGLDQAGVDRG